MPRRRSAVSLREAAIQYVSRHLELTCSGRGLAAALLSPCPPDLSGLPVTCLPATVLAELLERLALSHLGQLPSDQLQLPLVALHLLLRPHSQHLRLLPALPALPAVSILASTCHRLTSLDLSFCSALCPSALAVLVSRLPLLHSLDLTGSLADDLTLASLGRHCPRLALLGLRGTPVSARGLGSLSRTLPAGRPACPKLASLDLLDTAIIPYAVYEVIVRHRLLREVKYESFEEVLRCFAVMSAALGEWEITSQLRSLNFVNCQSDGLLATLQHCPEVFPALDSLSILRSDLTRSSLDTLRLLSRLTALELGNSSFTQYTVYFHEHVVPLLDHLGTKLTQLSLQRFKFVDVEAIGESCPKLQELRLSKILSFCNSPCPRFPLLNLERLSVLNTRGGRLTEASLRSLLTSSRIASLTLHSVASLTDHLLLSLLQAGQLAELELCSLARCPGLTAAGLALLLASPSPLRSLACWGCGLGDRDREALAGTVREGNLALALEWQERVEEEEPGDHMPDLEDVEELLAHLGH